jgi:hypothetical protein
MINKNDNIALFNNKASSDDICGNCWDFKKYIKEDIAGSCWKHNKVVRRNDKACKDFEEKELCFRI